MKPPTTESKGIRPDTSKAKASVVKSSVQAPVKQLVKTLASVAAKSDISTHTSDKDKEQGQRVKPSQAKQEDKSSEAGRASDKSQAKKSPGAKNPVAGIPFVKDSKAARVTFTLLLVRPWVLVAGLWLVSLLGSAIAVQGLIKPRALMQALPEAPVEAPPVVTSSLISVEESDPETADAGLSEANSEAETAESTTVEASDGGNFPLWTLGVLTTGTCAAGCLAMSRRRAMARLSTARSKSRVRRKPVRVDAVRPIETAQGLKQPRKPVQTKTQAGPTERARKANLRPVGVKDAEVRGVSRVKKRRQRNRRVASQAPGSQNLLAKGNVAKGNVAKGNSVAKGRKQAQRAATHAHPARPRRVKRMSARAARQSMVSVVPASESHALDWTNGSLAHQMDVRSHRKAM